MAQVANRAGVSTSTVSLVLNEKPGVSAHVRAIVLQAAYELGYSLPKRHSHSTSADIKSIAVVHFGKDQDVAPGLSNLVSYYVAGIQDYCQKQNINWALFANYDQENKNHVGYQLLERNRFSFDGLIIITPMSRQITVLQRALEKHVPVVVISRHWPDLPISTVSQDHHQQARLAVDHLIALGHRQIAFLGNEMDAAYDWFKIRLETYQAAMAELEVYDPDLVAMGPDSRAAARSLFSRHPGVTAIFAVHDGSARQAIHGLEEIGIQVPGQVSVIGVGNDGQELDACPRLTTVGYPAQKLGYLAARVLLEHMQDPELSYSRIFVQSWVVERESCAPLARRQGKTAPSARRAALSLAGG